MRNRPQDCTAHASLLCRQSYVVTLNYFKVSGAVTHQFFLFFSYFVEGSDGAEACHGRRVIMSDDDESVPSFLEDVRVKFVEEKVCGVLRLHRQIWERSVVNEEFQTLLKNFFEKKSVIFFSSSKKDGLVASNEVRLLQNLQ